MQNKLTLRQRVEQLFGLPAMNMPWTLYIAQLNEAGKITARSIIDVLSIALTVIEEQDIKIKTLEAIKPDYSIPNPPEPIKEEPKVTTSIDLEQPPTKKVMDMQEKIDKTVENSFSEGLVDSILGDKPTEPKLDTT